MRPILVEPNANTAFMRGDASLLEVLAHAERLCINSVVLGELLDGLAAATRGSKNRAELARFLRV